MKNCFKFNKILFCWLIWKSRLNKPLQKLLIQWKSLNFLAKGKQLFKKIEEFLRYHKSINLFFFSFFQLRLQFKISKQKMSWITKKKYENVSAHWMIRSTLNSFHNLLSLQTNCQMISRNYDWLMYKHSVKNRIRDWLRNSIGTKTFLVEIRILFVLILICKICITKE